MRSWRFGFITLLLGFLYVALGAKIYGLQIQEGLLSRSATAEREAVSRSIEERGEIYITDKNGNRIQAAFAKKFPVAFAVPKSVTDVKGTATTVAEIFELEAEEVERLLSKPGDEYEAISKKISSEQAANISEIGLPGIYVEDDPFRFYPLGSLAAHVLGFVGPGDNGENNVGRYGIESAFEEELASGGDVLLTIDRNIQAQSERILQSLVRDFHGTGGTVIVEEPKTGRILALANYPNFDPNSYSESPVNNFLNPAVQAIYEPGSVFKILTMAAGIDSGKITPKTIFYDSGSLTLNGKTIKNWDLKAYGRTTMTEVIEHSINTGAAYAAEKTGYELFRDYLMKFGFEDKTGIELPGELTGTLKNLGADARDINFATASYGQGVAVTPIALVSAVSAIANDGIMMRPTIIAGTEPEAIRRVISEEAAKAVTEMMVTAVETARVAAIDKFTVAGKTGTAQVANPKGGGYLADEFIHSYAGFAPASDPRFVILLKLDRPATAPLAGATVVPAFRELTQFLLNYLNIPPDKMPVN